MPFAEMERVRAKLDGGGGGLRAFVTETVHSWVEMPWSELVHYLMLVFAVALALGARLVVHRNLRRKKNVTEFGRGDGRVRVSRLFIYPVKGCAGVEVREASVGARGVAYDRHWAVVGRRKEGGDMQALTPETAPQLVLVQPSLELGEEAVGDGAASEVVLKGIRLAAPGAEGDGCFLLAPNSQRSTTRSEPLTKFRIRGTAAESEWVTGVDCGDSCARWFSDVVGSQWTDLRVVRLSAKHSRRAPLRGDRVTGAKGVSFSDFPVLVVSEESVQALARSMESTADKGPLIERLRPNVVISGVPQPHFEDLLHHFTAGNVEFFGGALHPVPAGVGVDSRREGKSGLFGKHVVPVKVSSAGYIAVGDELRGKEDAGENR